MSKLIENYSLLLSRAPAILAVLVFLGFYLMIFAANFIEDSRLARLVILLGFSGAAYIWMAWPHAVVLKKTERELDRIYYAIFIIQFLAIALILTQGWNRDYKAGDVSESQDFGLILILFSWLTSAVYHAKITSPGITTVSVAKYFFAIYFFPFGAFFLEKTPRSVS